MAFGNRDNKSNGNKAITAGVLWEINALTSAKIDGLTQKVDINSSKIDSALVRLNEIGQNAEPSTKIVEAFNSLQEEYASIKREIKFIAAQNERIFLELSAQIKQLAAATGEAPAQPVQVDLEELADKIAARLNADKDDFDIVVDEEGCTAVADHVAKNLNYNAIAEIVAEKLRSEKLAQAQLSDEFDVVIDEEGINTISKTVSNEVLGYSNSRFEEIEKQLAELKEILKNGICVCEKPVPAVESEQYVAEESTLVTVSDVTHCEPENCATENEEFAELAELVEEIDEIPAEGEIDEFDESAGGVDFANMMRYNRSFIARIIQSSDDQKEYYGRVKTALLSYAKVNSNVAWGAERFNKGRETIARFKIRGKTLCLYLALDPKEFEYSVYHQVDVSDNKSMHGTPMMVKIKSPRGVKKAIRLIDELLARRNGVKRAKFVERNFAAMYPYESIEELIEDGLVKDVSKNR